MDNNNNDYVLCKKIHCYKKQENQINSKQANKETNVQT